MKAVAFLGLMVLFLACYVFLPSQQTYEIQTREEKRDGELVPIIGAKIGLEEVHIYSKGSRVTQSYEETITDAQGKAVVSFKEGLFFLRGRTFCIEIEDSKYCTKMARLSDGLSIPLAKDTIEQSSLVLEKSNRRCFAKLDRSTTVKKMEIGCRKIADGPEISALKSKLYF